MSENIEIKVAIKTINQTADNDLIKALEYTFQNTGAIVEVEASQYQRKTFEPIEIVVAVSKFVGLAAVTRYGLEPVFKWLDHLFVNWVSAVKSRHPLQPINITLKFPDVDLEIQTAPYL